MLVILPIPNPSSTPAMIPPKEKPLREDRMSNVMINPAPPDFLLLLGFFLLTYVSVSLPEYQKRLYHIKDVKERKNRLKNAKNSSLRKKTDPVKNSFATGRNGPAGVRAENARSRPDRSAEASA
jgi:hypothetical protein